MAWKATGSPTVRKQRDKWVVRVDGLDTVTGKHKPKQLGTGLVAPGTRGGAARTPVGRLTTYPYFGLIYP